MGEKIDFLIFFLKFLLTPYPLDWDNSKWEKRRNSVGIFATYSGQSRSKWWNLSFKKIDNATRYNTKVIYLTDPVYDLLLENSRQLRKIAGKEVRTLGSGHFFKMPTMWEFAKYFYHE